MPSPSASHLRSGLIIEFGSVTFPAFGGTPGYWSKYETLAKDGISSVTVRPVLKGFHVTADLGIIEIRCHFDPEILPEARYGLVYTDSMFQQNIEAWFCKVLGTPKSLCASFDYSEWGMQRPDYISMEPDRKTREWISLMSHHHILSLIQRPEIDCVSIGDVRWQRQTTMPKR